jgi:hypothetical protein
MSNLEEKINEAEAKAKEIYDLIVFLERGINNDSPYKEIKLFENYDFIIGTVNIYDEMLRLSVQPYINLSEEIRAKYNKSIQILTNIRTLMNNISIFPEDDLLAKHGVILHDNREQKQEIIPDTTDPLTLDVISDGQTIAYLIDKSNKKLMDKKNKKYPPPPFIYDKNNYGIRELILSSETPNNPMTREKIKEIHLYTAEVPDVKESDKKGGTRKTKNKRRKTIKRRKDSKKTKI